MADYNISAVPRRKVYTGSAGVGPYAFTFEVLEQTDITVYKNATRLTLTTDYTVTINANGTGSVTLVSAATGSDRIVIVGARDIERTTDFVTAGDLTAASLNEQLDANVIHSQQLAESLSRAIRAPVYDPELEENGGTVNMELPAAATRAGNFLAFDDDGNPLAAAGTGLEIDVLNALNAILQDETGEVITGENINLVSSFTNGLLDNVDAAAWRTDLAVPGLTSNTFTGRQTATGFDVSAITSVASAATTDLGAAATREVLITGTTTITAFGTVAAGVRVAGRFGGVLTLTHNGTSLILPGGANITTAAGDRFVALSLGSGNWIVTDYVRASGRAVSGAVAQVVNTTAGALTTATSTIPYDDTIPQNTEGTEILTRAITPTNASSTLVIEVVINGAVASANDLVIALFQDSTANALAVASFYMDSAGGRGTVRLRHEMTAGTTSSTTFRVRVGTAGGVAFDINGSGGGARRFGGVFISGIYITEILP